MEQLVLKLVPLVSSTMLVFVSVAVPVVVRVLMIPTIALTALVLLPS